MASIKLPKGLSNSSDSSSDQQVDLDGIVDRGRTQIHELEVAGETRNADRVRVLIAVRLWRAVAESNTSSHRETLAQRAFRWTRKELPEVDDESIDAMAGVGDGVPTAAQTEGEGQTDPDFDGSVADDLINQARQPERTFDDIIGEDLKARLETAMEEILLAIELPELTVFKHANLATLLFTGPPGSGKTLSAEALAHRLSHRLNEMRDEEAIFIPVAGGQIKDHRYGNSQSRLEALFRWADANGPAVLFIDEVEEVATRDQHDATASIANTVQELTDGADAVDDVVFIGATNRPDQVEEAIVDRATRVPFQTPPPDAKRDILLKFLADDGIEYTFDPERLTNLDLDGLSGRELRHAVKRALIIARDGKVPVEVDFETMSAGIDQIRDDSLPASDHR